MIFACFLTVIVELTWFLLINSSYRKIDFILICIFINITTNLSLNLSLSYITLTGNLLAIYLYCAELAVVVIEYFVYRFIRKDRYMFMHTFIANILSYCTGLVLFGTVY